MFRRAYAISVYRIIARRSHEFGLLVQGHDEPRGISGENKDRYRVEFLTPNTGSADYDNQRVPMPALGGIYAQPLRFLDLLLADPVRSVMLHRSGVSVTIPAPERYAVHKLIVASRRQDDDNGILKRTKDVSQAQTLMGALIKTRRQVERAEVYAEAWRRSPSWKEALTRGLSYLADQHREGMTNGLAIGLVELGEEAAEFGL